MYDYTNTLLFGILYIRIFLFLLPLRRIQRRKAELDDENGELNERDGRSSCPQPQKTADRAEIIYQFHTFVLFNGHRLINKLL